MLIYIEFLFLLQGLLPVGGLIGGLLAGYIANWIGRKLSSVFSALPYLIGLTVRFYLLLKLIAVAQLIFNVLSFSKVPQVKNRFVFIDLVPLCTLSHLIQFI